MQKRCLGQTKIEMSVIGLGTVKFGRNQGVKYPTAFELPSDAAILTLLDVAQELGINVLDTAPAYGASEERLGKLLNKRHEWILVGKAGEEFVDGKSSFDFSKSAITASVHRSLTRLKTDYLDCLLIHSNGDDVRIIEEDDVFSTLDQLKSAGKIRSYGMSTKSLEGAKLTLQYADVAMITYHPSYTEELDAIHFAQQNQKGILVKKALASGHINQIGSPVDALRFVLNESGVTSVIVGTLNPEHLRENVNGLS